MFGIIDWVKEKFIKKYAKKYLTSLVIAITSALGGYLKASGHVDIETIQNFLKALTDLSAELIPVLIAVIYSLFNDNKTEKKAKEEAIKEIQSK